MSHAVDSGWEAFGQEERLTTRLRGLVRNYPKGVGILKEFIQNADDAGATRLEVVVDWQSHASKNLPLAAMVELQGPALLVINDQTFSEEDLINIQNIGHGGKIRQVNKTGRFGLGFNAVYNVTDFPCLLTRDQFCLFDPHRRIVGHQGSHSRGLKHRLDANLWKKYPDLLMPFMACGLLRDAETSQGTIFRLPLRTSEQAAHSEIRKEPFTKRDVEDVLNQLQALGSQILLFLKHLLEIRVVEVDSRGIRRDRFHISTLNPEEVQSARDRINQLAAGETAAVLARLQALEHGCCSVPFLHRIRVASESARKTQTWRIVSGMYCGSNQELLAMTRKMLEAGEKALPWAGAAAPVMDDAANRKRLSDFEGHVYCFLPLPQQAPLPFHINGFFDLDDSRHRVTADEAVLGKDKIRSQWNEQLTLHAVSRACADLLESLKTDVGNENQELFCQYWPSGAAQLPPGLQSLCPQVYRLLWDRDLVSANVEGRWVRPSAVRTLPPEYQQLKEPLLSEIVMPVPDLPAFITDGFGVCGGLQQLTPTVLRNQLRVYVDIDKPLKAVGRRALAKKQWIISMLEFCLSDGGLDQMRGVPLALHDDGVLHAFGYVQGGTILADSMQRRIFEQHPEWFLDPELQLLPGMKACAAIQLTQMTVADVLKTMGSAILKTVAPGESYEWQPAGPKIPNSKWVTLVYEYLDECCRNAQPPEHEGLCVLPLVPDDHDRLWPMGCLCTPLLAAEDADPGLVNAVRGFGVEVVHASKELLVAMRSFGASWPGAGPTLVTLTPGELVDSLEYVSSGQSHEWPTYRKELHDCVLDFLADEQHKTEFTEDRLHALRKLRLFPTNSVHVVTLEETVFIPTNYKPPSMVEGIPMLQLGRNRQWAWLLKILGVPELDRATLLIRWLLPRYGGMRREQQVETLRWMRDNYAQIIAELEEQPERAAEVRAALAHSDLVQCTDGQLHAASNLYEPFNDLVQQVLGSAVPIPDMKVYAKSSDLWLDFFRSLGMADTPRARDLSKYIMSLTEQWSTESCKQKQQLRRRIAQTLDHVQAHWGQLASENIAIGKDGHEVPFSRFLADTAWLPCRADTYRGHDLAGFRPGEDRLFRPSELHPPRNAPLIASQLPVMAFTEPSTEVSEALGFPKTPPLAAVLDHMDVLLTMVETELNDDTSPSLATSFRSIYRHLGFVFRDEPGAGSDSDAGTVAVEEISVQAIRERFADRRCICDRNNRFWLPSKAFKERLPEFGDLRGYVTITNSPEGDRGLTILGRRATVEPIDLLSFLEDLAAQLDSHPAPESLRDDIRRVLQRLATACQEDPSVITEGVQVLAADGQLASDRCVLVDDAPWLEERLSHDLLRDAGLFLADRSLPDMVLATLRLRRLSSCVLQRLQSSPQPVHDAAKQSQCGVLQDVIRSEQFREGLRRLIRHQRRPDGSSNLGWLQQVSIKLVDSLPTQLYIQDGAGDIIVGQGDGDFFYDGELEAIYLAESTEDLIGSFIAKAINERLRRDGLNLDDLADLEKIVLSSPKQIARLLSRLHVPALPHQSVLTYEPADQAEVGMEISVEPAPSDESASTDSAAGQESATTQETPPDAIGSAETRESQDAKETRGSQPDGPDQIGPGDTSAGSRAVSSGGSSSPSDSTATAATDSPAADSDSVAASSQETAQLGHDAQDPHNRHRAPGQRQAQRHAPPGAAGSKPEGLRAPRPPTPRPRRGRVVTYVVPDGQPDKDPNPHYNDADEPRQVGDKAVELVLAYERRAGRNAQKMAHNNPGYDVKSSSRDGSEERYIEVKGLTGAWGEEGVPVSPRQFETAQEWKDSFWLYVVEFCCEPKKARIHPIQDPARKITQFRFDSGWIHLEDKPITDLLKPGVWLMIKDRGKAEICEVEPQGRQRMLTVRYERGGRGIHLFNSATMTIVPHTGA